MATSPICRRRLPRRVVIDHMKEQALLALQGPKAVDALSRLAPGVDDAHLHDRRRLRRLAASRAWISRSGYTGEDGFEISVPASAVEPIADLLTDQPEVKPIGLGARDSLRLEAGLPLYGHDLDTDTTPVEADLGFAISKRRRAEGGFPAPARIVGELDGGADPQARRPRRSRAASRCARARWWSMPKAMKSAR